MPVLLLDRTATPVDDLTRRELNAAGLATAVLSACGSGDDDVEDTGTEGTRAVDHVAGTTDVPVRPDRVAALFITVATNLVSVGLTPVGTDGIFREWLAPYQPLLDAAVDLSQIEPVVSADGPNLERIASLDPEVIVAVSPAQEDDYGQLSEIAPTLLFEFFGTQAWREFFALTTDAVGRSDEAEAVRGRYRQALAEAALPPAEVSFIRAGGEGTFRLDGPASFPGDVAAEAGMSVTELPAGTGMAETPAFTELSLERLDLVTGDLIVVGDFANADADGADPLVDFERQPLWAGLRAVKTDQVSVVPGSIYNGGSYLPAQLLVKELSGVLA